MLTTTPLETLKTLRNNTALTRDDWILIKSIYENQQSKFHLCGCKHPCKQLLFTCEGSQTFESPHPAAGLGKMVTTFKCNKGPHCRKSYNAVAFLLKYQELQTVSNSTALKRPRVQSPLTQMSVDNSSWNDSITPEMASLSSRIHVSMMSNSNSDSVESKIDKLAELFLDFKEQSIQRAESNQDMFDRMLSSIDKLLCRNEALEQRVEELQQRLNDTEAKLQSLSEGTVNSSVVLSASSTSANDTSLIESNTQITKQPSWAAIAKAPASTRLALAHEKAKSTVSRPDRLDGFKALSLLKSKRIPQRKRLEVGKTKAVYFGGFEFQKLGNIWNALKKAMFKVSLIASIQWVGKTVLEFVIAEDYEEEFTAELTSEKAFNFRVLQFDPTQNAKATTVEQSQTALRAFSIRCVKNILMSDNIVARNHFERLASKACGENEELKAIFDVEYKRCKQEIDNEIENLIYRLTDVGVEDDEDYLPSIHRLRVLQPTHFLVTEYLRKREENQKERVKAGSKPSEALAASSE
jgi:hypothetical protein